MSDPVRLAEPLCHPDGDLLLPPSFYVPLWFKFFNSILNGAPKPFYLSCKSFCRVGSIVTMTDLNAGVLDLGSDVRGTRMLHSG